MAKGQGPPRDGGEETGKTPAQQEGMIGISAKFAQINKLITRDLNKHVAAPAYALCSRDDIQTYLQNPARFEKQLRRAVVYLYGASPHFHRLIQYFVGLSDLAYVVSPSKIDPATVNKKTLSRNYRKVLNLMTAMNVRTQFPKILTVCLREDTFYGTCWITPDSVTIQQLPSDYCAISTIEDNVFNVTFDFAYFDTRGALLEYYPAEFREKYERYKGDRKNRWRELDSPTSFAIKCNNDILDYSLPPFAGILREVYDLEDYKSLRMAKTALDNYAMLSMKLPMDDEGNWLLDYSKAKEFWGNLDAVLPDEVGSVLTPMDISKISFERTHTGETDAVAEAEKDLFSAAGVSSMLFNNDKPSANALALSIKADQAITFGIVKSIEDMVNRLLHAQNYGRNFKVTFLDCSPYNRKEIGDQYLKAATYGLPTVMLYAASQGLGQAEFDSMNYLENDVLGLKSALVPLKSATQSPAEESEAPTDEGGRPPVEGTELSETGEETREMGDNWR